MIRRVVLYMDTLCSETILTLHYKLFRLQLVTYPSRWANKIMPAPTCQDWYSLMTLGKLQMGRGNVRKGHRRIFKIPKVLEKCAIQVIRKVLQAKKKKGWDTKSEPGVPGICKQR